jgi:sugar phosphate isomerase/epimerase
MLNIGSNINEARVDGSLRAMRRDLESFAEFGLTAAEISVHGLDAVRNGRLDRRRTTEIASILRDFPFRYSTHAPNPLNLMDQNCPELHRDVLLASLEFTAAIGAECMVYHPGRFLVEEEFGIRGPSPVAAGDKERLLEREARTLAAAADAFSEVTLAMENARPYTYHSPYCYAEMPFELARQIRVIDRDNVRMTLDFGHLHLSARYYELDEVEEVRAVADLIAHCHVHDNFGRSINYSEKNQAHQIPFGKGDSHMPVGWGDIAFADLFATFVHDYEGLLICELRSRYFERTPEASGNLAGVLHGIGAGRACVQAG